jgi:hypothetical protein
VTDSKLVYLAFENKQLKRGPRDLMACTHCNNKTFAVIYLAEQTFPQLECAACHSHLGAVGWAENTK